MTFEIIFFPFDVIRRILTGHSVGYPLFEISEICFASYKNRGGLPTIKYPPRFSLNRVVSENFLAVFASSTVLHVPKLLLASVAR